ncbi:MAG: sensor histidine kinase [Clostridia bacterium]|nr:sensor histidine kinase [Clostridia bacterium]
MRKNRAASSPEVRGRRFSLRFQLVALMLLCYLIPVFVLGFFARHVLRYGLQEKVEAALVSSAQHAWTMTCQNLDRVVSLGQETVYDEELAGAWAKWRASSVSNAEFLQTSRNYLERKFGRDHLFTFASFLPVADQELLISNPSGQLAASEFFRQDYSRVLRAAENLDTRSLFLGSGGQLCYVRNVMNLRLEKTGVLILGLDQSQLFSPLWTLRDSWNGEIRLCLDQFGNTDTDWESLPAGFTDLPGEKLIRYVQADAAGDYELRLSLTLDRTEQYRDLYFFQNLSIGLYLLLIPLLILIILFVRRRLIRPISLLADASRRIEAGELGVTVPMRGGDELGDLGVAFSGMSVRLRDLIEKTYQGEIELKNAQIQALQSRINPHFLNNALETINWQARLEGSETISNMIGALSVLLNATLARKNRRIVSLREELEVAEGYIYFIQQRFGDALVIRREIDPEAEKCILPLLTVQPVLENAVEHGIAPAGGGEIRLAARAAGSCLELRITNTGRSIQPEDRARIDAALAGETGESSHLGLANIANRLRLLYGQRARITVSGGPDLETVVEIHVPQDEA